MLNRRHKAILFVTIVLTGCALLSGASLNQGLGTLLLGSAFAWVIGSEAANRVIRYVPRIPGRSWPWLRIPVFVALAGGLLAVIAIWSNYNPFFVCGSMSLLGLLVSPFSHLPTENKWLKTSVWVASVVFFYLAAAGVAGLSGVAGANAGRNRRGL